jgi:hypothetical protein
MPYRDGFSQTHPMPKQTGQFLIHTYKLSGVRNGEAGTGQTNILVRLYFFQWTAGKNPTQSYCRSTVRFVPTGMRIATRYCATSGPVMTPMCLIVKLLLIGAARPEPLHKQT